MLLSDEITLTLDRTNRYSNLCFFKYKLIIHNSNEKEALISLIFNRKMSRYSEEYSAIEYQQAKIPHELTAKQWLVSMVLKEDVLFKDIEENKNFDNDERIEMLKIKEKLGLIAQQVKIKCFN
jgi:hypothetical protein